MKPIIITGLALIVVGIGALVFQRFTYTSREKIIDLGAIEATANTQKTIPLSPILGGVAIASGIGLVIIGRKKP
jgi:hypothetical protein